MSRLHQFPLMGAEALAWSPSRHDGVPENMEKRRQRLAAQHMKAVSCKFDMSVVTWAIAVTFFNRFYTRKSMKKNNTFVIACASLFLASKVENEAQSHTKLANEMLKAWFGKDNPQLKSMAAQSQQAHAAALAAVHRRGGGAVPALPPDPFQAMYAAVLEGERALLYTVGFDFNVDIVHTHIARVCNRPRMKAIRLHMPEHKLVQNKLVGIANDVYAKDSMLVLQYPPEKIAIAAFYLMFKMAKANKLTSIPQPAPGAGGMPWYEEEGLSTAECIEITTRFTDNVYSNRMAVGEKRKAPPAPPAPTTGAASTAMLGACESDAYSGGGPTLNGYGRSEPGSGADALGEHTSLPRTLSSDIASGSIHYSKWVVGDSPAELASAVVAVEASVAGAAVHASPSKRTRLQLPATVASSDATSAAVSPLAARPLIQSSLSAAQPCNGTALGVTPDVAHVPVTASAATMPAVPQVVASAPVLAAAAADSDKEEGELEEGELE